MIALFDIDAASRKGGEVWVAAGTYYGEIEPCPYVYLYGGFAGGESIREERDWVSNETILDGNAEWGVVTATRIGHRLSAIDGFTIRNAFNWGISCLYSSLTISNNIISACGLGIPCSYSSPIISNNTITNNRNGIHCFDSSPTISNNTISSNSATYYGGGIYCSSSSPTISNNIISSNSATYYGGGIYCSASSPAITNNTITGNNADEGGGMYFSNCMPTLSNNIVAFNSSGIYKSGTIGTPVLRNNCVFNPDGYDYSGLSAGEGDFSLDPLFRDPASGDYHLRWDSPCINAGWNDAPGLPEFDFDGEGRICWGVVDIGADEYWPIKVKIDIKPGEYPNCINPRSRGLVAVAILSGPSFDAAVVDPSTVTFAGAGVATRGTALCAELRDVNRDGYIDLLLHFETQSLVLPPGAAQAQLVGRTFDGEYIEGSDGIVLVPLK